MGSDALKVVLRQLGPPRGMIVREVVRPLEQAPAGLEVGGGLKESSQALLGAIVRHPDWSLYAGGLVDERQMRVATVPLDLVHADRLDPRDPGEPAPTTPHVLGSNKRFFWSC